MPQRQQGKNSSHTLNRNEKIFLSILSVLVIYVFVDFYMLEDIRREKANRQSISISKNVLITQSGYWGANNEADYEKFRNMSKVNNELGIKLLISTGKVFPLPEGKEAIIVENNLSLIKIRLDSENREIWTSLNAVK